MMNPFRLRRFSSLVSTACLVMGLAACASPGGAPTPGVAAEATRIAFFDTLNLDLNGTKIHYYQAAKLAVEHVNAAGGINGKPIQLVNYDYGDSNTTDQVGSNVQNLQATAQKALDEGVVAFIGPEASLPEVVTTIAIPHQVVDLSFASLNPALTDDGRAQGYFYRVRMDIGKEGAAYAQLLKADGVKKLAVVYDGGYGTWNGFTTSLRAQLDGSGVDATYLSVESAKSVYDQVVNKIPSDVDALLVVLNSAPLATCLKDMDLAGDPLLGQVKLYLGKDGSNPTIVQNLDKQVLEGAKGIKPEWTGASLSAFQADYKARYGVEPEFQAPAGYDCAMLACLAMAQGGRNSREAIRQHLTAVANGGAAGDGPHVGYGQDGVASALRLIAEGQAVNYDGLTGPVDYNAKGLIKKGTYRAWRYADGVLTEEAVTFDSLDP